MVRQRKEAVRYRSPDEQWRHCLGLGCKRLFRSTHAGHRFCGSCSSKNTQIGGVDVSTSRRPNRRKEGGE